MATLIEVPTFVRGEPGFATKLNQLGEAVRELQAAINATPAEAPKAPAARRTTKATAKAE